MGWLDGLRKSLSGGSPPAVFLGAFGKHPGWDDHIEPINLESEQLLAARDILYVRGIGGVIDGALWDRKPEETLPAIGHVFSWNGDSDMIVGRMWSSVDGKGRAKYPLVAVAHLGVPFSYSLLLRTSRVLADVESRCRQATTAAEVREIFATGQETLRTSLAQPPDGLGAEPDRAACSRLANDMGLGDGEAFARVLYALEGKAATFAHARKSASGKISHKMLEVDLPEQLLRLPMEPIDSVEGIAFWQKIVTDFMELKLPLLFLHPVGFAWVDLIIGTPTPKTLYSIRTNETGLPPASAIPYELDASYRQKAADFIAKTCDLVPGKARPAAPATELPPPLPLAW